MSIQLSDPKLFFQREKGKREYHLNVELSSSTSIISIITHDTSSQNADIPVVLVTIIVDEEQSDAATLPSNAIIENIDIGTWNENDEFDVDVIAMDKDRKKPKTDRKKVKSSAAAEVSKPIVS